MKPPLLMEIDHGTFKISHKKIGQRNMPFMSIVLETFSDTNKLYSQLAKDTASMVASGTEPPTIPNHLAHLPNHPRLEFSCASGA
jgi:hypothetical protein